MRKLYVSKQFIERLKLEAEPSSRIVIRGMEVVVHHALPIEVTYAACSMATKQEISVSEYIHAFHIEQPEMSWHEAQEQKAGDEHLHGWFNDWWKVGECISRIKAEYMCPPQRATINGKFII